MKKKLWSILTLLLPFAAALAGCGGNTNNPYSPILVGSTGSTGATPDFQVSVTPISPTPVFTESDNVSSRGATNTVAFTVSVRGLNGFTGAVTLGGVNDQNSNLFTTSFQPSSTVKVSGSGTQAAAFSVALAGFVTPGIYSFTISGSSGGVTHVATVHPQVKVNQATAPSFTITNITSPQNITPSETMFPYGDAKFTLNVTSVGGFAGTVTLQIVTNPSSNFQPSVQPASVTLAAGQTKSVILDTELDDPVISNGDYTFIVSGSSGGTTVNAAPNPVVIIQGSQFQNSSRKNTHLAGLAN